MLHRLEESNHAWPKDESKLNRVRALMKDQEVSALVVRAPDNVCISPTIGA